MTVLYIVSLSYLAFFLFISGYSNHPLGIYTQLPLIIIPVVGGLLGLRRSQRWGWLKSSMGRAVLFMSIGLAVWGVALGLWAYYLLTNTAFPYPSLADFIFVWTGVLYVLGAMQLSRVVGAPFGLKNGKELVVGLITTLVVAILAYYLLVIVAKNNVWSVPGETNLQLFFDYAYTVEALAVIIITAGVFSFSYKYLGGRYKFPVVILFVGFITHFLGIVSFSKTVVDQTYFNGNIADILFTFTVCLESLAIINLDPNLKLKKDE